MENLYKIKKEKKRFVFKNELVEMENIYLTRDEHGIVFVDYVCEKELKHGEIFKFFKTWSLTYIIIFKYLSNKQCLYLYTLLNLLL